MELWIFTATKMPNQWRILGHNFIIITFLCYFLSIVLVLFKAKKCSNFFHCLNFFRVPVCIYERIKKANQSKHALDTAVVSTRCRHKFKMAEIGDQFLIGGRKLAQLKNDELKHELEKRGLKKSGNKAALIERLSEVRSSRSTIFFQCLFSTVNIVNLILR